MKSKRKSKILISIAVAIVVFCAAFVGYLHSEGYEAKATHLPDETSINGIDCSGLTKEEAIRKLTDEWNKNDIEIKRDGKGVAKFSLKNVSYDIDGSIDEIIGTNFMKVLSNHYGSSKKEHRLQMKIADSASLEKTILKDKFLDIPYDVKTKDAYIDMSDTKFRIIKEVYGDNLDKNKVVKAILKGVTKGKFQLDFDPNKYVDVPEIKKDDEVLKEEREFDKEHYTQKFVYEKFNGTYRITPGDIKAMRPVDENGNAKVDKKAIANFMEKKLAWEVNTQYFDRKFKTHDGKTITTSGTYGYVLDKKKEAEQLAEDLKKNADFSREPVFAQKPYYTGKGKSDLGDDYIEVSISQQTLWLYKKGKVVFGTSVTTGRDGNSTEPGNYYIEYKDRNATLSGPDYENKVSYWMPFNGDQGCHDATWRHDFGSSGYHSSGSHGCVNMPYYEAARLYQEIEKGFPVVVY